MSTKIKKKAEAVKAVKAVAKKTVKVAAPKAVKAVAPVVATATTAYEIESDAFFPPSKRASRGSAAYPFAALTIGQSFFEAAEAVDPFLFTDESEAEKEQRSLVERVSNRIAAAKRRFVKLNPEAGYQFAMRSLKDPAKGWGVRVRREA